MKCGTTSLHRYLGLHPEVFMCAEKELNFFLEEGSWRRGIEWYASRFRADAPVRGEASPSYTHAPFFSGVAERMAAVVPGARLVYLIRDPLERMVSHWMHARAAGEEERAIEDALGDLSRNPYLEASRYFAQLEPFLERYPAERVLVLRSDDLLLEREATLARVFRFLGVEPSFRSAAFRRLEHRSEEKRVPTRLGRRWLDSAPARALARLPAPVARRLTRAALRPLSRPLVRPRLDAALARRLRASLRADGEALSRWSGLDLAPWYD